MTTGEKIKETRLKKGITQKELAERLGTSPQNLSQYESDKRKPKLDTLKRIAVALDVTIPDLIGNWSDYSTEDFQIQIVDNIKDERDLKEAEDILQNQKDRYKEKYPFNIRIIVALDELNDTGKEKAIDYVEDLTKIPEYRQDQSPDSQQ